MRLVEQVDKFLQENDLTTSSLVVGLSGGVDSVVLLSMLVALKKQRQFQLSAIHVNHGLSPNAKDWQNSVADLCQRLGVPLVIKSVSIHKEKSASIEQLARQARYQVIAESMDNNAVLLTGHHQNDQLETFFLRLMRGAGLKGLSSMAPVNKFPNSLGRQKQLQIVRPLLAVNKSQLTEHCQLQQLNWVEDESNQDQRYDRNFIRHSVAPVLSKRWSHCQDSISRSTEALQTDFELLNEYLMADLTEMLNKGFNGDAGLSISQLVRRSPVKQKALVRLFIVQISDISPSKIVVERVLNEVISAREGQQPKVTLGNAISIQRHRQHLYCVNLSPNNEVESNNLALNEPTTVLPEWSLCSQLKIKVADFYADKWHVAWGNLSDSLKPNPELGSKKVKAILKDNNCPVWYRDKIPLIYRNDKLIAVGNLAFSHDFEGLIEFE